MKSFACMLVVVFVLLFCGIALARGAPPTNQDKIQTLVAQSVISVDVGFSVAQAEATQSQGRDIFLYEAHRVANSTAPLNLYSGQPEPRPESTWRTEPDNSITTSRRSPVVMRT